MKISFKRSPKPFDLETQITISDDDFKTAINDFNTYVTQIIQSYQANTTSLKTAMNQFNTVSNGTTITWNGTTQTNGTATPMSILHLSRKNFRADRAGHSVVSYESQGQTYVFVSDNLAPLQQGYAYISRCDDAFENPVMICVWKDALLDYIDMTTVPV
jgi:outer membrane lipoprotein-sorting protein